MHIATTMQLDKVDRMQPSRHSKSATSPAFLAETLCMARTPMSDPPPALPSNSIVDSSPPKIKGPPKIRMLCEDKTQTVKKVKITQTMASGKAWVGVNCVLIYKLKKSSSYERASTWNYKIISKKLIMQKLMFNLIIRSWILRGIKPITSRH